MNTFHFGEKLVAALSDEKRKSILRVLACGERSETMIAEELPLGKNTLSADLSVLQNVNLIGKRTSVESETWILMPDAERIVANFLKNNNLPASEEYCKLIK